MAIHEAPNVLVIHLKRFSGITGAKITRHIGFESRLSLEPYLSLTSPDLGLKEAAPSCNGLGMANFCPASVS